MKTPNRKPLAPIEIEIGKRLREFREARGMSSVKAAGFAGFTPEQLRTYEDGRTPLKWHAFVRLAKTFHLSARWLATGKGSVQWHFQKRKLPDGAGKLNFSQVYELVLAPEFASADQVARLERANAVETLEKFLAAAKEDEICPVVLHRLAEMAERHQKNPRVAPLALA